MYKKKNSGHNVCSKILVIEIKSFRGRIEVVLQIESLLRYQYYIYPTSQRSGKIHYLTLRAS